MEDIEIRDFGLFESIRTNAQGIPNGGVQLTGNVIPPDLETVRVYFRLGGKPGSYWLAGDVKHETEEPNLSVKIESQYITIPSGGDCHLVFPFGLEGMPRGHYVFVLSVGSNKLARFGFSIG